MMGDGPYTRNVQVEKALGSLWVWLLQHFGETFSSHLTMLLQIGLK